MNKDLRPRQPADTASGWLIVHRDGTIVTAGRGACVLLGAPDTAALAGRDWKSLLPYDRAVPPAARKALASGGVWHGRLAYRYAWDEVTLDTAILPVTRSPDLSVVSLELPVGGHLQERVATATGGRPPRLDGRPPVRHGQDTHHTLSGTEQAPRVDVRALEAQLAVHEALRDLDDPAAAARAVLQALHSSVPFEWGAVLRFQQDTVEVLATYPSPLGGLQAGIHWRPPGATEADVRRLGQPVMEGDLLPGVGGLSPLGRLPSFGLRSRLLLPLHAGTEVVGALVIYRPGPRGFIATDGITAERTVRRLGEAVASAPEMPSQMSSASASERLTQAERMASERLAEQALPASRLESLGELVAGVAHELNNPLTAILGYAQIVSSLEGAERDHALRTIESEAQRAARIVRNLLAFARQRPGERQATDLEAVLRRIIDLRRYSLEVDDVRVITHFGHVPAVHVDEGQFEQVFLNLLSNAHQALQGRGGEVQVNTWTRNDRVYVSVADDGPGIPAEIRARVFDPFFTTHEVGGGEGMGLSIVYGVVTNHGGRTWVEPSPAGGANFIVELPVERPAPLPETMPIPETVRGVPPSARPAGPAAAKGGYTRILVVDDEAPVRALTQEILSAQGYQVSTADTGHAALQLLEQDAFRLVITDLRMPGMGGSDLYHEIGQRWPHLRERVLFVTGDIEGDRGGRALDRDQVRYLEKPFTTQQLLDAIGEVLGAQA